MLDRLEKGRMVFKIRSSQFSVRKLPEVGFVYVVVVGLEVAKHRRHRFVRRKRGSRTAHYAVP